MDAATEIRLQEAMASTPWDYANPEVADELVFTLQEYVREIQSENATIRRALGTTEIDVEVMDEADDSTPTPVRNWLTLTAVGHLGAAAADLQGAISKIDSVSVHLAGGGSLANSFSGSLTAFQIILEAMAENIVAIARDLDNGHAPGVNS